MERKLSGGSARAGVKESAPRLHERLFWFPAGPVAGVLWFPAGPVAGVLWFPGHLVAGVACVGCPWSVCADWCSGKVWTSSRALAAR